MPLGFVDLEPLWKMFRFREETTKLTIIILSLLFIYLLRYIARKGGGPGMANNSGPKDDERMS